VRLRLLFSTPSHISARGLRYTTILCHYFSKEKSHEENKGKTEQRDRVFLEAADQQNKHGAL
jgi:hypothetical protein